MPDLPFILAGPIVRRVTPEAASVWVALSNTADVTLSIWRGSLTTGPGDGIFVPTVVASYSATKHTVRIGPKLHIALVTITTPAAPAAPLLPGEVYSYNLIFSGPAGSSDLKSLKLLEDKPPSGSDPIPHFAMGYIPGLLPSFVLPPLTADRLNLVHGSCRRIHAPGNDTMAALDGIISKAVGDSDPGPRIHQLLLTGDQIYADEIPILLLPSINALGKTLLGVDESLKAKKSDSSTGTYAATMTNFPATRRQRLVNRNVHFSTGEGINHLLSFGEFAGTYLMYWNNEVWPAALYANDDDLKALDDFLDTWDTDPLTSVEQELAPLDADEQQKYAAETPQKKSGRIADVKQKLQERYKSELSDVLTFRNQLPKVRRVLANVAVYMIMDDHEVTDDWYISRDWKDKVLTTPLGVNIVRNGMMAYALFQDLGNAPATYDTGTKADLLVRLQQLFPVGATSGPAVAATDAIDVLFGFNLPDETPPPVKWHYSIPSSESTIFVLETRTRRTYETRYSPPGLLSKSAMDDQIPLSPQPDRFLIFVSPAPVLGLGLIEELLQPAVTVFSRFEADPEPWAFSPSVFEEFLKRMQKFKRVVLLSGDVHFGLTAVMDYWKKGEAQPARIIQFVSSGVKNQKFKNDQFLSSGLVQKILGSLFYPAERLGWDHRAGLQVTNPANAPYQPAYRVRLRKEPVLLPTHGWPAGTTTSQPPDWSWRVRLAADERPDDSSADARPAKVQVQSITPDVNPMTGNASDAYRKVLARHVDIFKKSVGRKIEWDNNIGLVKFSTDVSGNLTVSHHLWFWLPGEDPDEDPDEYVVWSASLEPTGDASPSIA